MTTPTYFLDFDRTLFDTSSFLSHIIARDGREDIFDSSDVDRAIALNVAAKEGLLSFAPGELFPFMFPDADAFLDANQERSVIVTFGNIPLQTAKLENVLANRASLRILYTGEERKGAVVARLAREYPPPWVFVDDKPIELDSVASLCPDAVVYEMRRDGKEGCGRYPVLRSFSELP